jgi:hemerythrin-like domain-containing protein
LISIKRSSRGALRLGAMTPEKAIASWHTEHAYFGRLLDLLQREVECLRRGKRAHCAVMLDIVEYLQVYGDRYHHAREDAAFSFLAFRRPDLEPALERLRDDHVVIERLGERLVDDLDDTVEGLAVSREDLTALAMTYLRVYREHIAEEEGRIVDAASVLTAEDWGSIGEAVPKAFDALFGVPPEQRYRELERQRAL